MDLLLAELAPDGGSEADNPVVKGPVDLPATFADHARVPHWETGAALGILDLHETTLVVGKT